MLPLEGTLLEKLRKIEALHAGTTVDGEREAARRAAERIRAASRNFVAASRTPNCMGRRDELRALQTYGRVVGRSSRPVLTCEEAYVFLP
jgi:hypothetical protein